MMMHILKLVCAIQIAGRATITEASFVSISEIKCNAFSHQVKSVRLSVTMDGENFGPSDVMFTYYDPCEPPKLDDVHPKCGHHRDESDITIYGTNFAPVYTDPKLQLCHFYPGGSVPASFVASDEMRCAILPLTTKCQFHIQQR